MARERDRPKEQEWDDLERKLGDWVGSDGVLDGAVEDAIEKLRASSGGRHATLTRKHIEGVAELIRCVLNARENEIMQAVKTIKTICER